MNQTLEAELRGLAEGWKREAETKRQKARGFYHQYGYVREVPLLDVETATLDKLASQLEAALERGRE